MQRETTLITGASSGIGLELARVFAREGHPLILSARNEAKLLELKNELEAAHPIKVHVFASDLSKAEAAQSLVASIQAAGHKIEILVNNAGVGDYGPFADSSWEKMNNMIQLNITSLTHLTRLVLPSMIRAKRGHVMNVASTAGFQPGPLMAVYYATKAYVLHLSEAIGNELSGTGVTVTALCPGPTQSGFQEVASMQRVKMLKKLNIPTSKEVAEYGYQAMTEGKSVAIHGLMNKIVVASVRFTPRSLITRIVRKIQESD